MMRWYTGAEVTEVFARGSRGLDDLTEPAVVSGSVAFDDDSVGTFESNWARRPDHPAYRSDQFRVTGTDGFAEKRERANVQVTTAAGFEYEQPTELHGKAIGALRNQVDHIIDCAATGTEPMVTWKDGLASLVVGNALRESLEQGRPVTVDYPDV
jgi:predicted dehydrogenase